MAACNQYSGLGCREAPTLFLEFHGTQAGVAEQVGLPYHATISWGDQSGQTQHLHLQVGLVAGIAGGRGGGQFHWAETTEDRNRSGG